MINVSVGRRKHRRLALVFWSGTIAFLVAAFLISYAWWRSSGWHIDKVDGNKIMMQNVVQALDAYKVQFGQYPDKLDALVETGVMPGMPLDKWERPLHYQLVPPASYRIATFGRDGKPGGAGADQDIVIP